MQHISDIINNLDIVTEDQHDAMHDEFYGLESCTTCGHILEHCHCGAVEQSSKGCQQAAESLNLTSSSK
jgi:uncharacterized Fe-S center protein